MTELAVAVAKSTSAWDQPGTVAFLVVFGMAVILYFVFRSLAKHLRKVNEAARMEAMRSGAGEAGTRGTAGNGTQGAGTGMQDASAGRPARGSQGPLAGTDHDRPQSEANAGMMDFDF